MRLPFWRTRAAGSSWGRRRTTTVECPCWPGEAGDPQGRGWRKGRDLRVFGKAWVCISLWTRPFPHSIISPLRLAEYHLLQWVDNSDVKDSTHSTNCRYSSTWHCRALRLFIKHISHHIMNLVPTLIQKLWSSRAVYSVALEQVYLRLNPSLPLPSCVTQGKFVSFSVSQFSHQ